VKFHCFRLTKKSKLAKECGAAKTPLLNLIFLKRRVKQNASEPRRLAQADQDEPLLARTSERSLVASDPGATGKFSGIPLEIQ